MLNKTGIIERHADKAYGFWYSHNVFRLDGTFDAEKSRSLQAWFAYEGNLTERKLLAMGQEAFGWFMTEIGRDESVWNDAPHDQQLKWCKSRGGKYSDVILTIDYEFRTVNYNHDAGSGSHSLENVYRNDEGWLA